MEWTNKTIGDIAFVTKLAGFEHTKYIQGNCIHERKDDSFIPLFIGKTVRDGRIDKNFDWYIPKSIADQLPRSFLKRKCLVLPYVGTIGDLAVFDASYDALLGSNIAKIELNPNCGYSEEFIYYYLKSPRGQTVLLKDEQGGIQKNITMEAIRNVLLPDVDENNQRKIVSVLSALDDKIALNKKMNQKLEAMAKRLYDYWFVQYDFPDKNGHPYKTTGGPMTYNPTLKRDIPAGWEVKKVSDYADLITKGTTPSTLGFDFQDTGINFVKVECIENGQILQENLMHISEEANIAMKRSQLRSNDILVTIAGRLGSTAIVSDNILPANTNQAVALIRLKKEYGHLVNYIYRVISSSSMQKRLQGSNAQSIQKNLTLPILGDIEFVQDFNCEIIKRFNEITKPIFLEQQENIQEISRLTKLRDKLLPLLMNGQVEVK